MRRLLAVPVAVVPFVRLVACSPAPAPQAPMVPAETVSVAPGHSLPPLPAPEPKSFAGAATGEEPDEDGPVGSTTTPTSSAPLFVPIPTATTPPPGLGSGPPFDRGAAAQALGSVNARTCARTGGPTGAGHVTVTFAGTGTVVAAVVDAGPFPNTSVGACIAQLFSAVRVPPFSGAPVRVGKSFVIP